MKNTTTTWEVRWPRPKEAGTMTQGSDPKPMEDIVVPRTDEAEARAMALVKALEGNVVRVVRLDATVVDTYTRGRAEEFLCPPKCEAVDMSEYDVVAKRPFRKGHDDGALD